MQTVNSFRKAYRGECKFIRHVYVIIILTVGNSYTTRLEVKFERGTYFSLFLSKINNMQSDL